MERKGILQHSISNNLTFGKGKKFTNGLSMVSTKPLRFWGTSNFFRTEFKALVSAARLQQPLCAALCI
jgi:hypothetical protein